MTKRMLIDATHAEETRVVVLDGNRLEDFDVETSTKRQLKGNIYLAKVIRVEPSLQAAFVEYGGNRHGFLAFSEIHPDYYQIPVADRQRLVEMQAEEARREEEEDDLELALTHAATGDDAPAATVVQAGSEAWATAGTPPLLITPAAVAHTGETSGPPLPDGRTLPAAAGPASTPAEAWAVSDSPALTITAETAQPLRVAVSEIVAEHDAEEIDSYELNGEAIEPLPPPETLGGGDHEGGEEHHRERRIPPRFLRNYKIQEVIRRRQIMLVQVVKEERGTKGAALTSYLSLAGRFGVLMPNSPRGGGISRKITSATDRRRLREVIAELDVPRGMGLIVRTAGANRPKPEIKRDCEYLLRLWDDIREHTMKSVAPALIYEEASLIKRAIRDVYSRDIDEILVDGEDGWRAARDFMRMLMPAHAKKVQMWRDGTSPGGQPLFARQQVEAQLDAMLMPIVQLRSGGYLVINQAEALVAIDVNSGRSTRERNIEETALRTNLEAADEVARQLRLRDLAGLIVIDFIDMESKRHNAMVERRLKEALKNDRARIQVGHISHFGLLEMSRQRLRPSLAETSFIACPHCGGTGHVRSTESSAIHVLRGVEDEGGKRRSAEIIVHVSTPVALYLLNHKRERLREIELRYTMRVVVAADDTQIAPQFRIEKLRIRSPDEIPPVVTPDRPTPLLVAEVDAEDDDDRDEAGFDEEDDEAGEDAGDEARLTEAGGEDDEPRRKRRRRRRRGNRRDDQPENADSAAGADQDTASVNADAAASPDILVPAEAMPTETAPMAATSDAAAVEEAALSGAAVGGMAADAPALTGSAAGEGASADAPGERAAAPQTASGPANLVDAAAARAVAPQPKTRKGTAGEEPAEPVDAAADEEARARRRGRRGGRRRRRENEGDISPLAEPGAEQPDVAAAYAGPTPADPFGQVFDIFDVMERVEQHSSGPARRASTRTGGAANRTTPEPVPTDVQPGPDTAPSDTASSDTAPSRITADHAPPASAVAGEIVNTSAPEPSGEPVALDEAAPTLPLEAVMPDTAGNGAIDGGPAPAAVEESPANGKDAAGGNGAATGNGTAPANGATIDEPAPPEPPAAEPAIKPIVIGAAGEQPAEKKRGWWRR